ncbi:GntR family transcriptional regulator [Streptomyces sp. SID8377]|nr:GntR family transcriptional regulator [Streptomyces sp. SID8377]MYX35063.1 GntR family transcriptional regulator [Streptomyces sp. SID8377]
MDVGGEGLDPAVPPYRGISQVLRGEIRSGLYRVGSQIPTQQSLARRFAVSRVTVQRALEELRSEGFIDSQRGRGSYVLSNVPRPRETTSRSLPGTSGVALAKHINTAFEAPRVTLDVFSLTTESLNAALALPLLRVRGGEIRPESVRVRILLPNLEGPLAVPRRVGDPEDDLPLKRLRELVRNHTGTLVSSIVALSDLGLVSDVSVEVKSVAATPLTKVYLINETESLHGFYSVVERPVLYRGEEMRIYDFLGLGSMLFHCSAAAAGPDSYDSAFVEQSKAWFESLWSTIAQPLTLFE